MITALLILGWIICGVLAYGLTLYDFTNEYPGMSHKGISKLMGIMGPFGLLATLVMAYTDYDDPREEQLANAEMKVAELACEVENLTAEVQRLRAKLGRIAWEAQHD